MCFFLPAAFYHSSRSSYGRGVPIAMIRSNRHGMAMYSKYVYCLVRVAVWLMPMTIWQLIADGISQERRKDLSVLGHKHRVQMGLQTKFTAESENECDIPRMISRQDIADNKDAADSALVYRCQRVGGLLADSHEYHSCMAASGRPHM